MLPYVPLVILALSVLVFIHEFGHFIVARAFGMRVQVFSIGLGPVLWQWRPKGSETVYQVCLVPLLAYVKIAGMSPQDPVDPTDRGSYQNASALGRFFAIAAGPLANYLAATAIVFGLLFFGGVTHPPDYRRVEATVSGVMPSFPAQQAGVRPGDTIVRVGETPTPTWESLLTAMTASQGRPQALEIRRGRETVRVQVTPRRNRDNTRYVIGVEPPRGTVEKVPFGRAAREAMLIPAWQTVEQVKAFARMIRGQERPQVMGPVKIVAEAARAAEYGIKAAMEVFAAISLALFFFNLLPIPALDGGRLVFLGYELLVRRKVPANIETPATTVSIVLLLGMGAVIFMFESYEVIFKRLFGIS